MKLKRALGIISDEQQPKPKKPAADQLSIAYSDERDMNPKRRKKKGPKGNPWWPWW